MLHFRSKFLSPIRSLRKVFGMENKVGTLSIIKLSLFFSRSHRTLPGASGPFQDPLDPSRTPRILPGPLVVVVVVLMVVLVVVVALLVTVVVKEGSGRPKIKK
jgi:hypothetical protein